MGAGRHDGTGKEGVADEPTTGHQESQKWLTYLGNKPVTDRLGRGADLRQTSGRRYAPLRPACSSALPLPRSTRQRQADLSPHGRIRFVGQLKGGALSAAADPTRPSAQAAGPRASGTVSESAATSTGTTSSSPQFPNATHTLRSSPFRRVRRLITLDCKSLIPRTAFLGGVSTQPL
jgi:hypothetical protein